MTGEDSLIYDTPVSIIALATAILIMLFYFIGSYASKYYLRGQYATTHKEEVRSNNDGLTLLGFIYLLLSFTFGMSLTRYDARRTIIYQESNCIGTAILRCDLYSDSARAVLRKDFKDYVEARIAYYGSLQSGKEAIYRALEYGDQISGRIWTTAVHISKEQPNIVRDNQMLPALNLMIDTANSRDAVRLGRVPDAIIYLLLISVLAGSFIIGYDGRSWVVLGLFGIMTTITIFTVLDLDRPKQGFIQSDLTHTKIVKLREILK